MEELGPLGGHMLGVPPLNLPMPDLDMETMMNQSQNICNWYAGPSPCIPAQSISTFYNKKETPQFYTNILRFLTC